MKKSSRTACGGSKTRGRRGLKICLFASAAFGGGLAAAVGAQAWVTSTAARLIYRDPAAVPSRPVGIVFGARVYPNGVLSSVLRARVEAGVQLYKAGRVQKLLMTGDNGRTDYDEVTAMKKYAVARGVPREDVVRDFAGFRTFDSCYRARVIFQVDRAILVTQAYHLPRALFIARSLGMDAVGFAADPAVDDATLARFRLRETFATATALLDTALPNRRPRFLGRPEPIFGNQSPTR